MVSEVLGVTFMPEQSYPVGEYNYLNLLSYVMATGERRMDRTGVGITSYFNPPDLQFDNVGEYFPLFTTKKMAWKSIVAETLWFMQGRFDLESLRADGCTWWDEWEREDGTIGPGYGYQLRHWPTPFSKEMIQVERRHDEYKDYKYPYITDYKTKLSYDLNSDTCWAVGFLNDLKTPKIEIQFESGYVTSTTRANWRASQQKGTELLRDGYQKVVYGIGFKGYPKEHDTRTYNLWYNMLARCYNEEHPQYRFYGASGVTVSPVWHSFEKFLETLPLVLGYHEWRRGGDLQLDKDYFGSNVYSPNTSRFITQQANCEMSSDGSAWEIGGIKYPSLKSWENRTGNDSWHAKARWLSGETYNGVAPSEAIKLIPEEGKLWRRQVEFDQIAWLVNEIKSNPTSRRLIATMWNAGELDDMALPPCHGALIQFYVSNVESTERNVLNLRVHIRSSDMFLGLPTNIASYALVLLMMAQATGTEPGSLYVGLGDAHIYNNHISAVMTQLSRTPVAAPFVEINPFVKEIDDFVPQDFTLHDYYPQPTIKAPIAV